MIKGTDIRHSSSKSTMQSTELLRMKWSICDYSEPLINCDPVMHFLPEH